MVEDVAKRFNKPYRPGFTKKHASYRWTKEEMSDAARVVAHSEVYERLGARDTRAEKKLLAFADSESEYARIKQIIARERLDMVERAKDDPYWSHDSMPRIDSDEETRSRKRRAKIIPIGAGVLLACVAIGIAAMQPSDNNANFTMEVSTLDSNAEVASVDFTNVDDRLVTYYSKNGDIPNSGNVVSNEPILAVKNGDSSFVNVRGKGDISCKIFRNGEMVVSAAGADSVSCQYDEEKKR